MAEAPVRLRWLAITAAICALLMTGWITTASARNTPEPTTALTYNAGNHHPPTLAFRNARTGYAITTTCSTSCDYRLWVTFTGGTSWRGYDLAVPLAGIQPATVAMTILPAGQLMLTGGEHAWISDNHGRDWQVAPRATHAHLTAVPGHSHTRLQCADDHCTMRVLLADGSRAELDTAPPLTRTTSTEWQAVHDGVVVATGYDTAGAHQLAVSVDAGSSWTLRPINPAAVATALVNNRIAVWNPAGLTIYRADTGTAISEPLATPSTPSHLRLADDTLALHTLNGELYLAPEPVIGGGGTDVNRASYPQPTWYPIDVSAISAR